MNKNTLLVGFMLFAMFFGAGNLIFPPHLGFENSSNFWPPIIGFIITGVGLPLIGVIASSFYPGGYKDMLNKIHPWFSIAFLSAIYLSIGPFFAIPRTAATAYEMTVIPFVDEAKTTFLLIFTALYFMLSLWFALNPSKMVERIGTILTPLLLLSILALIIKAMFLFNDGTTISVPTETSAQSSFFHGFINGYLTMDALASIAFSAIVVMSIQRKGHVEGSDLIKQTSAATMVAAVFLAFIYITLAWVGKSISIDAATLAQLTAKHQDIGTYILNSTALQTFGSFGQILLGIIVFLACLTTTIGLTAAVSKYFNEIYHKISYKTYAVIFTLIGFVLANQGLSAVIDKSVPVLLVLYPIAITIIFLLFINQLAPLSLSGERVSILLVALVSILSVAEIPFTRELPLKQYSMEWLPFAVIGYILGWLCSTLLKASRRIS